MGGDTSVGDQFEEALQNAANRNQGQVIADIMAPGFGLPMLANWAADSAEAAGLSVQRGEAAIGAGLGGGEETPDGRQKGTMSDAPVGGVATADGASADAEELRRKIEEEERIRRSLRGQRALFSAEGGMLGFPSLLGG